MSIKVNINRQFLQSRTTDWTTVEVSGNTVGECLHHLVKQLPAIKKKIFNKDDKLLDWICIFVNWKDTFPEPLAKPVKDGDEIHIMPLILGG